jgi:hypothetical protein
MTDTPVKKKSFYSGWELPEGERSRLLALFPAVYTDVIAHHITRVRGVTEDEPLPEQTQAVVVGVANDGARVQALVCEIGGTTKRPDGNTYHVTWSLDREQGAKPVMSNDVIREKGWEAVPRIPFRIVPKLFR